ncbi:MULTISPECIES: hypothetical protein [Nocardia]|uniref:hypothetical protein n=1 Tax=Nocardia TaxID=1817 RepID=UPI0002E05123|nr:MULTISPECIES: hypothetical protein [Nocardia]
MITLEQQAVDEETDIAAAERMSEQYRDEHDFDTTVSKQGRILLRTGVVEAIQMPRALGVRVLEALDKQGVATPVVENWRTDFLTFLTSAAPAGDQRPVHLMQRASTPEVPAPTLEVAVGLFQVAAIRTVGGTELPLPGPDDPVRAWLRRPTGRLAEFNPLAKLTVDIGAAVRQQEGRR